jgi:hypothetical protein
LFPEAFGNFSTQSSLTSNNQVRTSGLFFLEGNAN